MSNATKHNDPDQEKSRRSQVTAIAAIVSAVISGALGYAGSRVQASAEISELRADLRVAGERSARQAGEIEGLARDKSEARTRLQTDERDLEECQRREDALEDDVRSAGDARARAQEELIRCRDSLTRAQEEADRSGAACREDLARARQRAEELKDDLDAAGAALNACHEERGSLRERIAASEAEATRCRAEFVSCQDGLTGAVADSDRLRSELRVVLSELDECKQMLAPLLEAGIYAHCLALASPPDGKIAYYGDYYRDRMEDRRFQLIGKPADVMPEVGDYATTIGFVNLHDDYPQKKGDEWFAGPIIGALPPGTNVQIVQVENTGIGYGWFGGMHYVKYRLAQPPALTARPRNEVLTLDHEANQ